MKRERDAVFPSSFIPHPSSLLFILHPSAFILVLIAALAYNSALFHLPGNRRGRRINDMGCSRIGLAAGLPTFVLRAHVDFYLRPDGFSDSDHSPTSLKHPSENLDTHRAARGLD